MGVSLSRFCRAIINISLSRELITLKYKLSVYRLFRTILLSCEVKQIKFDLPGWPNFSLFPGLFFILPLQYGLVDFYLPKLIYCPNGQVQRFMICLHPDGEAQRNRSDQYAYQIAEIQQKTHKRTSSVSSSENFSSSRSDSWRQNHHCGIPLRLLDPKRRASSWLVTRKTSQDSNLSSSRNDSSGSATTQSTSTWRMSRSSASSDVRTQVYRGTSVFSMFGTQHYPPVQRENKSVC